jgi:hypothetical protein
VLAQQPYSNTVISGRKEIDRRIRDPGERPASEIDGTMFAATAKPAVEVQCRDAFRQQDRVETGQLECAAGDSSASRSCRVAENGGESP